MRLMTLGKVRLAAGALLAGCLWGQVPLTDVGQDGIQPALVSGWRARQTTIRRAGPSPRDFQQPSGQPFPDFTYQNGALIANANFWMVYWGSYWTSGQGLLERKHFNSFVQSVAPSAGFTGLFAQYQQPSKPILAGAWAGEKPIADSVPAVTVDDSAIQNQIADWITASVLPVPDANTVYVILPPAGVDVTIGSSSACDSFLGYHSAAYSPTGSFGRYRYIVLPHQDCGADLAVDGPVMFDGMTDTLGHEMSETITDPDGFFSTFTAGWTDENTGMELADVCADTSATIGYLNFWMQKIWSQTGGTCIGPVSGSPSIHLTVSTNANSFGGDTEVSGVADVMPGYPATFTLTTDSILPVSLSVLGVPSGVTYSLSQPTVTAAAAAALQISTGTSPGASGTATLVATQASQRAQFQFLVVPWIQVSTVNVTQTAFTATGRLYTGAITIHNTGSQPIGPTILLACHGLDSRILAESVGGANNASSIQNEVAPSGDATFQFASGMLAPGQSVTANVAFSNPYNLAIDFTPQVLVVQSAQPCDISQTAATNVADVQLMVNESLGAMAATDDLNNDGAANIADVQLVIDSALGLGCASAPVMR